MRILHVIPQWGLGGAERVVADLVQWQADHGDEPRVCITGRCADGILPRLRPAPTALGYSGSFKDLKGLAQCIRLLNRTVDEFQPDRIHAHLWPAALLSSVVAAAKKVDCLVHIHDARSWLSTTQLRYRIHRAMYRRAMASASIHFAAVSHATMDYTTRYLPWTEGRIRVVHNGINTGQFQRRRTLESSVLTFGAVGRIEHDKGFHELITAGAELDRRKIDFRIVIAGDGPQKKALLALASELGIASKVSFPGPVQDMPGFYEQLDAFVLPSYSEGLPISLLEAMAMELPIIASNVGGIPEVIQDPSQGLLVPAGAWPLLADAMIRLAGSEALRRELGCKARRRVESQFSVDSMAQRIRECYVEPATAK